MTTYTVKSTGGNYSSLNAALGAIATGAISDAPGHEIILETIGTEPTTSYSFTGSGAGASRINPVTIRVATTGGPFLLDITKAGSFTNVPSIRWDLSGSGTSRLRFRGFWQLNGGCHGWEFHGDTDVNAGPLDGETGWTAGTQSGTWLGNLFIQYGFLTRRINDELVWNGVKFVHRRKGSTSGVRGYTVPGNVGVTCLKIDSSYSSGQTRPSDGIQILDCEFARYANDAIHVLGMSNSLIQDFWIHDLYPTEPNNVVHIDGFHIMQAYQSTIDRGLIERVLYQGAWLKTDSSPATFVGDTTGTYNSLNGLTVSNVIARTFGGPFLTAAGAPEFDPDLTFVEPSDGSTRPYGATGGTAFGVTNARKVLIAHCVGVEQFTGAGLEVNYTNSSSRPRLPQGGTWLNSTSDMDVDVVNSVFSWVACDRSGGKLSIDPKSLGTWRNNHQTTIKASTGNYEVVTVAGVGDLTIGVPPLWSSTFEPFTGSPLIDAGYDSTLSTGLALPAADYNGTTWTGLRNIGAYETAGAAAPLVASAGLDTTGVEDTPIQLDGAGTTSPATTTWSWAKLSGPGAVVFSSTTAPAPTATIADPGVYVIRLTASTVETPGTTATDDVTVTVTAATGPEPTTGPHLIDDGVLLLDGIAHVIMR